MKLELLRISSGKDSTSGLLYDVTNGRDFLCYTLEDEYRDSYKEKVYAETRIPSGTYNITLRTKGRIHEKYKSRFKDIHKGTLWVRNVPNFKYILIHCGNTDDHSAGCLIIGEYQKNNQVYKNGYVGSSTDAYKRIYPLIAKALENGECVSITYRDFG